MSDYNYLEKTIEIKNWIENNENKIPPSKKSKDEVEKSLAKDLKYIQKKIVKPYQKLKKEKDIIEFEEKHPDTKKIIQIIHEIEVEKIEENLKIINQDVDEQKQDIDLELEQNIQHDETKFEYDTSNSNQTDLANLIVKDIKIRKTIEEANKLKRKYEDK